MNQPLENRTLNPAVPYKRLSLFYLLYFSLLGCIAPFWGLYLQHKSFSAEDIGLLMASFGLVRILAPNLWAAMGHRFTSPLHMVRLAGVLTLGCFSLIFVADSIVSMAVVMVSYGFFWAAMLPQYEAITMQALKNRIEEYSRIRLWGSLGFILIVLVAGALLDVVSISYLPWLMLLLMLCIVINSWAIRSGSFRFREQPSDSNSFLRRVVRKPVMAFLIMSILLQISHGPFYTFFSIFLEENQYSGTEIGLLWSAGVAAEVILFWQFKRVLNWFSWADWCLVSFALTVVRWTLVALYPQSSVLMFVAQSMHALSFGAMHIIAMQYVQYFFPGRLHGQGQALYSSIGFGLGTAIGAYCSGLLWNTVGHANVFLLAAVAALAGFGVVWFGLRPEIPER
ncbi:MFS transporter [Thalassolituus marinus]|uniref:MFS transporter n=1 Tax=Thalassolituus marinus TaxID=671053 RepID=A0ABS7ZNU9_9GAMM|nr:MFS transporter [Thalassolituus marinus]MCA6063294.1 MFS transporter [Thalassolituus marinus]